MAIRETVDEVPLGRLRPTATTFPPVSVAAPGARARCRGRVFPRISGHTGQPVCAHACAVRELERCVDDRPRQPARSSCRAWRKVEDARARHATALLRIAAWNQKCSTRKLSRLLFALMPCAIGVRTMPLERGGVFTKGHTWSPAKTDGFFTSRLMRAGKPRKMASLYRVIHFLTEYEPELAQCYMSAKRLPSRCAATSGIKTNVKGNSFREVRLTSLIRIRGAHSSPGGAGRASGNVW